MSNINILSPHVADLIAAGEVVERPASVVKELLENALDAGAKNITVELRGAGLTYIRVTDDGCGMPPEDAGVAFLRHATSKLKDERGLEAIGTLGFRGEALAAISACSKIELLTRERGAREGCRITVEAGEIVSMGAYGCPEGTTMIVRGLFYNTPARLKFIKSERAEAAACVNLALRCALARPDVSVRCIKDEEEQFFSPGDGEPRSAVYSLLGRDIAGTMLECETERDGVRVRGFVSSPASGRGNRAHQYFFCNGRTIRSLTLQAALEQAYRNTLLTGRFPSCVLYIELSPGGVDVNVHPTKAEVRFGSEKAVFDGVYYAALAALGAERRVPDGAEEKPRPEPVFTQKPELFVSAAPAVPETRGEIKIERRTDSYAGTSVYTPSVTYERSPTVYIPRDLINAVPPVPSGAAASADSAGPVAYAAPTAPAYTEEEDAAVLVGETMSTYIIAERGEDLVFIDKHAAHERIIFDRLKAEGYEIMSQVLLTPLVIKSDGETVELVAKNAALLSELGFELEPFGERELILRAQPSYADEAEARALIEEVCEKLRRGQGVDAKGARDEILHTVACKAAIKAGRRSDPDELMAIVRRVMSGEIKYCPHGRPVSFTMQKKDLDKQFKRIV